MDAARRRRLVLFVRLSRWGVTAEWGHVSWSRLIASMTTSSLPLCYDMHCTRTRRTGLQLHGLFLGGIHSARPSQVNFICAKWSFDPRTLSVRGCFPSSRLRTVRVRRKNCGSTVDPDRCPHNTGDVPLLLYCCRCRPLTIRKPNRNRNRGF